MELYSCGAVLWTVTETGISTDKFSSSYYEEQLLHRKMCGSQQAAPCTASFQWKAILLVLVVFFFSAQENDFAMTFSALLFFPEETICYTSWIICCNGEQLFQETCWQMNMLFLFGENEQKAVFYLGCLLADFTSRPSVCINYCMLCQYMAWHFKKNWMSLVPAFLTYFSPNSLEHFKVQKYKCLHHWWHWPETVLYLAVTDWPFYILRHI